MRLGGRCPLTVVVKWRLAGESPLHTRRREGLAEQPGAHREVGAEGS